MDKMTADTKIFGATVFITVLLSLIFHDLFPFSINPLFTKKIPKFSFIIVKDENGKQLSNEALETYLDYASTFERSGIATPKSINNMGVLVSPLILTEHLVNKLNNVSTSRYFDITLKQVSLNDELIPKVRTEYFQIQNPTRVFNNNPKFYREDKYKHRIKNEALK